MILMDSDNQLAMNLGETYLVTNDGNERLGKKKIDIDLLRQVLPGKLKNIVNPLPPSRYYEAGGRVGFKDGSGDIKAGEKGNVEKIKKILSKKGIDIKSGKAESIAKKLLNDFGKMGLKGTKLLRWLQLEYDVLFEGLIFLNQIFSNQNYY